MAVYFFLAYLAGTFMTAYWVGKWNGVDLRKERSGNLGARNAGAVIGRSAFLFTFLGDAGKAAIVTAAGLSAGFSQLAAAAAGLMVLIGHLYPFWLRGKGGKGVASFIGASLIVSPVLIVFLAIGFSAAFAFTRSAVLSLPAGILTFAAASLPLGLAGEVWPLLLGGLLVLYRHRADFREAGRRFTAAG